MFNVTLSHSERDLLMQVLAELPIKLAMPLFQKLSAIPAAGSDNPPAEAPAESKESP